MIKAIEYVLYFIGIQLLIDAVIPVFVVKNASLTTMLVSNVVVITLFYFLKVLPRPSKYHLNWTDAILFALLAIATILPSLWIGELGPDASEELQIILHEILSVPIGFIIISILAPISEEIVFRGAIERSLLSWRRIENRPWIAIVISALMFAIAHFDLAQGFHAFLMGLLLGWLYMRTRSILPGIIIHLINNAIGSGLYFILPDENTKLIDIFGNVGLEVVFIVISLILLIGMIILLKKRLSVE